MRDGQPQALAAVGFTCPKCERTSHHPMDVHEQYCGACHEWFNEHGPMHYDLAGRPITIARFSELYSEIDNVCVGDSYRGDVRISTVWLGADFGFGLSQTPLIFETAIFGPGHSLNIMGRYATLRHAIKGHKLAVRWVVRSDPFSNPVPLSRAGAVVSRKHHARKAKR